MINDLCKTALAYHNENLQVIPLKKADKIPLGKWQNLIKKPETKDFIDNIFKSNDLNIGIVCGMISKNLFVSDYDSKQVFNNDYSKYPILKKIIDNTPIVETTRGFHIYMRYNKPVKSSKKGCIDLQSNGKYVVAPPSLHPSGQFYLFQDGFKKIYEVNFDEFNQLKEFLPLTLLTEQNKKTFENIETYPFIQRENTFGLGVRLFDCLLYGNLNGFHSRSEMEYSIVLKCISNGWSYLEIKNLFYRYAYKNAKFREHNETWFYNQYYLNAYNWLANNLNETQQTIDKLYQNCGVFDGRTKYTDIAVYQSILQIAKEKNRLNNVDLTIRQLQLKTNLHLNTIRYSLKRLCNLGLIIKHGFNTSYNNTIYKIVNVIVCINYDTLQKYNTNLDIYSKGGLNKVGKPIIEILNKTIDKPYPDNFITKKRIMELTNIKEPTVRRVLNKLEKYELLFKTNKNPYLYYIKQPITDKNLNDLAFKMGVMGKYNKLSYKIKQERQAFKEYKERLKNE